MRAQVLHRQGLIETRPLAYESVPVPMPGAGQLQLRVLACGVCRTDLHTVEGDIQPPRLPVIPGHQVVGVVEALGDGVTEFKRGDRAGAVWLNRACGCCEFCEGQRENLCEAAEFTGFHSNGGYAECMVIDADFAYPLPEELGSADAAPLLCGGVIGYRALRLSGLAPGQRLALYGFGNSAHVTIQVARHWGCRVVVFTRSAGHQEHARELGAEWVGTADQTPPFDVHAAIVFAPAGGLVPAALQVVRRGGVVALAGIHMSPLPEMPYELLYGERVVRSVANSTRQDARELLHLAAAIPIRTSVTAAPLSEANEMLLAMKESRLRGDGVLIP